MTRIWLGVALFFVLVVKAEPIGLVLAGGGAKGAYEVGVWKAICEIGLDREIVAISGTSVGGLNAALFTVVRDPRACERAWLDAIGGAFVCNTNVVRHALQQSVDDMNASLEGKDEVSRSDLWAALARTALAGLARATESVSTATGGKNETVGVCDSRRLRQVLRCSLPARKMPDSPAAYLTAVPKDRGGKVVFRLNGLPREAVLDRLMATTAIPAVFDAADVDGVLYVDGGYESRGGDNVPISPITANHPEIGTIIVVYLDDERRLGTKRVDKGGYIGKNIIEIVPSQDSHGLLGCINSDTERSRTLIDLGYRDALAVLRDVKNFRSNDAELF